jgi:hypothetical protein
MSEGEPIGRSFRKGMRSLRPGSVFAKHLAASVGIAGLLVVAVLLIETEEAMPVPAVKWLSDSGRQVAEMEKVFSGLRNPCFGSQCLLCGLWRGCLVRGAGSRAGPERFTAGGKRPSLSPVLSLAHPL